MALTIKKCRKISLESTQKAQRMCIVQFYEIRGFYKLDFPEFPRGTELNILHGAFCVVGNKEQKKYSKASLENLYMFYEATKEFLNYKDISLIWNCNKATCYTQYKINPYFMMNQEHVPEDVKKQFSFTYQDLLANIKETTFAIRRDEICLCMEEEIKKEEALGNTYCEYNVLERRVRETLALVGHPLREEERDLTPFLNYLVKTNVLYCDIEHFKYSIPVFRKETYATENDIYHDVKRLMESGNRFRTLIMENNPMLSEEQNNAVSETITSDGNINIITGGPGTGKTTIINEIIKRISEGKPNSKIKIVAPTGRAAKRAEETIQYRSDFISISTVHKFIGYGSSFANCDVEKYDVIILDEASMASPAIFRRLLSLMDKTRTKLVLVGDVDQLPSIDPGDILNDLIYLGVPTSYLTMNYRSDGSIERNSKLIKKGIDDLIYDERFELIQTSCLEFEDINKMIVKDASKDIIENDSFGNEVIISPYVTDTIEYSAGILNQDMHTSYKHIKPSSYQVGKFYNGEPVIFKKTNYRTGTVYFNGEVGRIIGCHTENGVSEYEISMDEDRVVVAPAEHIDPAFAITVHKSQGSEYNNVYIVIPEDTSFITRKLFYTAITRAKSKIKLYSTIPIIKNIIANVSDATRKTLLKLKNKFNEA